MVELALAAVILITLAIGTMEMGLAWNDSQLVTQATRSGARGATQLGQDPAADSFTVASIEATLGSLGTQVTRIVIYEANDPTGAMPAACETAGPPGVAGNCSVYDASDFGTYGSWVDGLWTPAERSNSFDGADYIGVRVELERPYVTGLFGTSPLSISDTTVMRIEPNAD